MAMKPSASIVTRKGQVTIPSEYRDRLNLKVGDHVTFLDEGGRIVVRNSVELIEELHGIAGRGVGTRPSKQSIHELVDEEDEFIADAWAADGDY